MGESIRKWPGVAVLATVSLSSPLAQVPGAPAFEVASLRRNVSGDANSGFNIRPGGTLLATNVAVRALISAAYRLQPSQLVGGPEWVSTDRYDIVAKAPVDVTREMAEPLLRALLAERFKLTVRREMRDLPVYALVRDRTDGSLGPRLAASLIDCSPAAAAARQAGVGAPVPAGRPVCSVSNSATRITGGGMSLPALAEALAPRLGRVVLDRTGLTGGFDFEITFATDAQLASPSDVPLPTALREQLGLRIEAVRAPLDVVVIDSIERPTDN